jgi:hypothetical protein
VRRKAGSSARGLLEQWVQLREQSPEVREMLQKVEVYQQPSGIVDGVIYEWINQRASEEVVMALHQREIVGPALCENARRADRLGHQVSVWIGGKMKPLLQLTNTDMSKSLKAAVAREQLHMRNAMRAQATAPDEVARLRCGALELLGVAHACHEAMVEHNLRNNAVLAGLRRNGMLSWRPCLSRRCLVRSDSQPWAQKLPEGSQRYPKEWLKERYEWRDERGEPQAPTWSRCGAGVLGIEDMVEVPLSCPGEKVHLSIWENSPKLAGGVEELHLLLKCDAENLGMRHCADVSQAQIRRALAEAVGKMTGVSAGGGSGAEKKKAWRKQRRIQRLAVRVALRRSSAKRRRKLLRASDDERHARRVQGLSKVKAKDPWGHFICLTEQSSMYSTIVVLVCSIAIVCAVSHSFPKYHDSMCSSTGEGAPSQMLLPLVIQVSSIAIVCGVSH